MLWLAFLAVWISTAVSLLPHHDPVRIAEDDGLIKVTSPMVGTFYRRPAPDQVKARPPDRAAAYELFKELEFAALTIWHALHHP